MSGQIVGRKYSLEREIGRGAMGTIWVALDTQLHRRVALKLMSPEQLSSAGSTSRFEREAMAIAQLQNPHVIQIYDYGVDDGSPYIVMELLEGEDLERRLSLQGTLSLAATSALVAQAAKALSAAHAVGIVHRDLKPANIFLVANGAQEVVKLLDFGVATAVAGFATESLLATRAGSLVGTPAFMSPEQARGRRIDHRGDLWSLAVIAYRALTGRLPFEAETFGELLIDICTASPAAPSTVAPHLDPALDKFFERALSKDPDGRFQSASEMTGALAALAEAAGPRRPAKVLVIDDEPDMALLIKQRFRQQIKSAVYEFFFAADGASALAELRRNPDIDVALSDINMPGMDGLAFLEHAGEVNPLLRVIMVSAYSDMSNIRAAMNHGAVDFLVKPVDFRDLTVTLEKEVTRARQVRRSVQSMDESSITRLFVNDSIVDKLLPHVRAEGVVVGEAVRGTVAFIDVCGFLSVVREAGADGSVRLLNTLFDVIVPEITSRRGEVDKFVGDAVMAVFRGKEHGERAIEACLAARAELSRLSELQGGDSPYARGIAAGIASGELVAGSVGSRALGRLDRTVLGPVVGAAARLSAAARKAEVLIDASTFEIVRDAFACREASEPGAHEVLGAIEAPAPVVAANEATVVIDRGMRE